MHATYTNDLSGFGIRDTLPFELALEHVFGRPFGELLADGRSRFGADYGRDLLVLGELLFNDMARLARGELSSISIPNRMPNPGEYVPG
jgi:hypothetical protein